MNKIFNFLTAIFLCLFFCSAKKEYSGMPVNKRWEKSIDTFCEKLAKKHHMQMLFTGRGPLIEIHKDGIVAVHLVERKKITIDQARQAVLNVTDDFWNFLNQNWELGEHRESLKSLAPIFSEPFTIDMMGIKISYWDENINRPASPYLAQIKVVEGKILYFYADSKTQALQEPIVETLEEARQKVTSS